MAPPGVYAPGGIVSAFVGGALTKRIDNKGVEGVLRVLLLVIIVIDLYNAVKFLVSL